MTVIKESDYDDIGCQNGFSTFWLKGERLRVTTIQKGLKTSTIDLLGLVGGYMGLFVGVSVTTICEFIEFVLMWIWDKIVFVKQKKVQSGTLRTESETKS